MRNDPARGGESTVAPPLGDIAWGVVLNAVVPVILYKVSKRYYSPSEFAALVMAALFPLGKGTFDLIRHRRLDPIAVVVPVASKIGWMVINLRNCPIKQQFS